MSGLAKIIDRISQESAEKAAGILAEARAYADGIRADAEKKTVAECERITKKAESEAANIAGRSEASAELRSKQILLAGKQELLTETIAMAKEKLANLSDAEYADVLTKLFMKHIPSQDAVLKLNAADMKRLPKEITDSFIRAAADNDCSLKLSEIPADIRNGFIIDFGGIEENCTFDALIDQNIEELQDKVKSILFA
mgnify:CR=1 FL=1